MEGIEYKMAVTYTEVGGRRNEFRVYEVCVLYKGCEGVAKFDDEFEYMWDGIEWEEETPEEWDLVQEAVQSWAIDNIENFVEVNS
jgi:hypothetical protein